MDSAWKELQPKNIYQGRKSYPLKEEGKSSLLYLYQPLIGGEALSLYFTLLSEISLESGEGPEGLHADLLSSLNCGLPKFYEVRKKLEGIGLLEVFFKEDPSLGSCFIYELLEPLDPFAFFKDNVLSFLLLEKTGQRRFDQLIQLFKPKRFLTNDYQKVTKKFLEVYRFSEETYAANQNKIEKVQQSFAVSPPSSLLKKEGPSSFDWSFLTDWLTRKHISSLSLALKEQVMMYHLLYGFDELTLGEWIVQAYDFTLQEVSLKELQRLVLANQQYQKNTVVEKESALSRNKNKAEKTVTTLTSAALQLVTEVKSIPPMKYLKALKQEKGGYISKQETWLLQDLVAQSGLSSSVVNVLINYVLVIKGRSSLTASYVNTIANEWAQKKIATPEEAVEHIRKISKAAQTTKKSQPSYSPNQRKVRREKLPDWVNQPKEAKKISSEKKAEIERRFKEYFAKKEGDK
ncbi:replication initiation and membrane attachment family protein [Enterococcus ratti]|uniref:Replication initiation and membrane attachment protein n=1 Tax=Enterococcus ratti TaxID=150033 RepID=A0A1L8WP66_9ENTE|nr:DnaD domain protein [Enterococcus ratti]OJG82821.1 replication initiation and membrane attachment protein [Enterococcus ratti]